MTGWILIKSAAEQLGIAPDSLRRKAQRQGWPMRGRGKGRQVLMPDDVYVTDADEAGSVEQESHSRSGPAGMIDRGAYVYDTDRDLYIVHLPSHSRPFVRSGEWIKALWRRYTDGAQINEVCREFEIDRRSFDELKTRLGLTKTAAPWTDEEIEQGADDDLIGDALERRKRKLLTRAEHLEWRRTKEDAAKFHAIKEWMREELRHVEWFAPEIPLVQVERREHVTIVGASDWHVGKRTAGKDHTLADQVAELKDYARAVAGAAIDLGVPQRFVVTVGGDLVHVDTMQQTTTKGTPQGAQSVGTTRGACAGALSVMATLIDSLSHVAPVEVRCVPGNHDRLTSYLISLALEQRYAQSECVFCTILETDRQYITVGDVPIMLTHGDQEKHTALPLLMAREMPAGCDLGKGVIIHGHLHRNSHTQEDHSGVQRICLRSPARPDDWHTLRGYVGAVPGTTLLVIDPQSGLRGTWFA